MSGNLGENAAQKVKNTSYCVLLLFFFVNVKSRMNALMQFLISM